MNFRFCLVSVGEVKISVMSVIEVLMTDSRRIWKNGFLLLVCSFCVLDAGCVGFETGLLMVVIILRGEYGKKIISQKNKFLL